MAELNGLKKIKEADIEGKKCNLERPFAFISYSHDAKDADIVWNVFNELYSRGYNLWIDTANIEESRESWRRYALTALFKENCKATMFFRSEASLIRDTIREELRVSKELPNIKKILTIDIWHEYESAEAYGNSLIQHREMEKYLMFGETTSIVEEKNSAIRLIDVNNSLDDLVDKLARRLEGVGVESDLLEWNNDEEFEFDFDSILKESNLKPDPIWPDFNWDDLTNPIPPVEKKSSTVGRSKGSIYSFELYGQKYTDMILKEMMLTVFKTVLYRHTDKLDQFLDAISCLGENIKLGKDTKPSLFRAGEVIQINGRNIAIGTSLAEPAVLKYIEKLIRTAGEPEEIFRLSSKKAKN